MSEAKRGIRNLVEICYLRQRGVVQMAPLPNVVFLRWQAARILRALTLCPLCGLGASHRLPADCIALLSEQIAILKLQLASARGNGPMELKNTERGVGATFV